MVPVELTTDEMVFLNLYREQDDHGKREFEKMVEAYVEKHLTPQQKEEIQKELDAMLEL